MKDEKWFFILPGRLSYDGVKMLRSGNPHGRYFHNLVYGIFFCFKKHFFFSVVCGKSFQLFYFSADYYFTFQYNKPVSKFIIIF